MYLYSYKYSMCWPSLYYVSIVSDQREVEYSYVNCISNTINTEYKTIMHKTNTKYFPPFLSQSPLPLSS